jgi:thermitase
MHTVIYTKLSLCLLVSAPSLPAKYFMKFAKNKIIAVAFVAIASGALFGGIWLQSNQSDSPAEPGRPQTSLPGAISPLGSAPNQDIEHVAKQSVVRFSSEGNKQDFLKANNLSPDDLQTVPQLANTYVVNRSEDQLKPVDAKVSQQQRYTALLTPDDPLYPQQWYTTRISASAAWDISTGSNSIIVADIDTGFALNHEDLAGRWAVGGWDFVNNDNDPSTGITDPGGAGVSHGTQTAGLIGATGNNAKGVASINWGVRILPLQALDDNGEGTSTDVASAIHYAVDRGAKVINMSLGTASPDPIVKAELDYAQSHDVVVVAAAGNCGSPSSYFLNGCSAVGQMIYPANYPQVLAVGATDINDTRASFSSYGPSLDVVAPGSGTIITTTWLASNQTSLYTSSISGTSFSSPIVAGLAALYRGYVTTSSASGTITAITSSADKLSAMSGQNFTVEYGYGRINAAHALAGTLSTPVAPPPVTPAPETPLTPLPEPVQPTHPNGTLISLAGRVYLVENGVKRWITNGDVFNSYGYPWFQVKLSSTGDANLPSGTDINTLAPGFVFTTDNSPVYVMTYQGSSLVKQQVSAAAFNALGYNWNEVVYVPPGNVPATTSSSILFANQHPAGTLVAGNSKVYLLAFDQTSNKVVKRWVLGPDAFNTNNFDWNKVKTGTTQDLVLPDGTPVDLRQGNMLISGGNIYLVDYDSTSILKRPVGPWECFADRWHYAYRDLYQTVALPDRTGSLATC